jgi:hypothetical protein
MAAGKTPEPLRGTPATVTRADDQQNRLSVQYPAGSGEVSGSAAHELARTGAPAFSRRAIASDIMTWHYDTPERLATHLEHDRAFVTWMATRGLNAFSYIRHSIDNRLKIDELLPLFRERGISSEYGGHILQLLLPRDRFDTNPEYFPASADGVRNSAGNLCVSNPAALEIVREGASRYVELNPECAMLHVWGADVWEGAWCRCGQCNAISPQLQYLSAVNAIAEKIATVYSSDLPVAYLAYHDTLEPDPALRPLPNVWFEWAPRERCYSHAIDDPACAVNPSYLESLKRHIDLFEGRGHIFEYYADAILFGGLGIATPATIARDLCAYRALGLASISCLTFGAHSTLAYPINLEAFARGTRSPDFEPGQVIADTAAERYPTCAGEMAEAYRAIARASLLILDDGGDVMRPKLKAHGSHSRVHDLRNARAEITRAIQAADNIVESVGDRFARAERDTWHYSREIVNGIAAYIEAAEKRGPEGLRRGDIAVKKIGDAINALRTSAPTAGDTWAAYDLEWIGDAWVKALRRRFSDTRTEEKA